MMDANSLLLEVLARRASDLHLKMGRPPLFRVHGELIPSELPVVGPEEMRSILSTLMDKKHADMFRENLEVDFSYQIPGKARYRVNAFLQRGLEAFGAFHAEFAEGHLIGLRGGRVVHLALGQNLVLLLRFARIADGGHRQEFVELVLHRL